MVKDAADDVRKLAFTLEALRQPAPFSESVELEADMDAAVDWMARRSAAEVQFVLGCGAGILAVSVC